LNSFSFFFLFSPSAITNATVTRHVVEVLMQPFVSLLYRNFLFFRRQVELKGDPEKPTPQPREQKMLVEFGAQFVCFSAFSLVISPPSEEYTNRGCQPEKARKFCSFPALIVFLLLIIVVVVGLLLQHGFADFECYLYYF
jgi:hypothetical protein